MASEDSYSLILRGCTLVVSALATSVHRAPQDEHFADSLVTGADLTGRAFALDGSGR